MLISEFTNTLKKDSKENGLPVFVQNVSDFREQSLKIRLQRKKKRLNLHGSILIGSFVKNRYVPSSSSLTTGPNFARLLPALTDIEIASASDISSGVAPASTAAL